MRRSLSLIFIFYLWYYPIKRQGLLYNFQHHIVGFSVWCFENSTVPHQKNCSHLLDLVNKKPGSHGESCWVESILIRYNIKSLTALSNQRIFFIILPWKRKNTGFPFSLVSFLSNVNSILILHIGSESVDYWVVFIFPTWTPPENLFSCRRDACREKYVLKLVRQYYAITASFLDHVKSRMFFSITPSLGR